MMKRMKMVLLVLILSAFLFTGGTCWAVSTTTIGQLPATLSNEELGFRFEAPPKASDKTYEVKVEATDSKKILPTEEYFVTKAVDIKIVNSSGKTAGNLTKPVRLIFTFNDIDHKRASNMNTK
ncbi:hypothetical protein L9W92_11770 [Pelotomaculum terephthalicicum JT]|uniref:hypothetical protein n=1 Tax=Pelotomaculum TaxID=191373 RepID=UPI0009D354A4|nr:MULTISPECIES: hypothetical protein [Pelotomaculum]MCG9968720.1 hypothetical protein [Pelotomaculum terephthalicicum JT]OPX92355.1 MAG: hypothetical protein A4E54_00007 [Pelotomaculum sp. PtaB.Bin117]